MYAICGLAPETFAPLFELDDAALAAHGGRRVVANSDRGFPCRVSLEDAREGDELLLLHYVSHDVATPYRSAYAIYVRKAAAQAVYEDSLPPVFAGRTLSLRAFDREGMIRTAQLTLPDGIEAAIRSLLSDPLTAYIDAYNAAYGCFAARIERSGSTSDDR